MLLHMTNENVVHLTVEFTGIAKDIAGQKEIQIEMAFEDTYHDVVSRLAELYPDLVNILIAPDKKTFLSSNLFIINDEMNDPVFFMEKHPRNGDRLTLLSVMTGG
jgi:molybdopterin converting factor small subunit